MGDDLVPDDQTQIVKDYYGTQLQTSDDLKTSACCSIDAVPAYQKKLLSRIDPEILDRFYGCGSPLPHAIEGCQLLDLGCGTGRDCYLAAQLVGPSGSVTGIDMTEQQLRIARKYLPTQMARFGFDEPNTRFLSGQIEDLSAIGIADQSIDVVISNCVINLSPDKARVLSEIWRVLKPGGELFFADIFADRRLPQELKSDPLLIGECLGGALYSEDFRRLMNGLGCLDFRVMSKTPIQLDAEIKAKTGPIQFSSITIRAFKIAELEDLCEDYGQVATYLGTVPECRHEFVLDDHHVFEAGRPERVCGNTAAMLTDTRFGSHFRVEGNRTRHFGLFDCAPQSDSSGSASCC